MTMYSINEADMKRILSLIAIELEQMKTLMKEKTEGGLDNLTDNNYKMVQEFTALKDLYLHLKWKSEN
jgi:2-oxo-4-hydroxy-4-carboxy--5-ureidoimidazoline (OHCU) decarboxylase